MQSEIEFYNTVNIIPETQHYTKIKHIVEAYDEIIYSTTNKDFDFFNYCYKNNIKNAKYRKVCETEYTASIVEIEY